MDNQIETLWQMVSEGIYFVWLQKRKLEFLCMYKPGATGVSEK